MNIEIANRLVELRKKSGLSQEDLADKIGVSRQAVSKWETASASPDTDNLICLAKLYGVSLDDLLNTDQPVEDIIAQKKEETKEGKKADKVDISLDGIHVVDKDGSEVHIGMNGIHVTDGSHVHVKTHIFENEVSKIIHSIALVIATIGYFLLSIFLPVAWGGWGFWWILFVAVPIPGEIYKMIIRQRLKYFPIALVATVAFFVLGIVFGLWHPGWAVFLLIPVYYTIAEPLDKLKEKKQIIIDGEVTDEIEADEEDD